MGKFIPGNPAIIVENMAGAASLISANHVYKVAKPDGLTIGHFIGGLFLQQVLGRHGVEFDARKFVAPERIKILREAFNKAVNDPALLAEAEKRRLDMDPASGEALETLAKEVMATPPAIVEKVKLLIGN